MGFKLLKLFASPVALTLFVGVHGQTIPTLPTLPTPITSGFTQKDLDSCKSHSPSPCVRSHSNRLNLVWQSVEQGNPVVKANITRVLEPIANFSSGPEPPRFRPGYLQASTKDLKLPKGFLYGVSTSSTQVEGAVKEGGRGPRYGHLCEMRHLPIPLTLFA